MTLTTEKDSDFSVNWNDNNYNDAERREHIRRHLQHMPYISNARNQKMAVWTDVKEIFFPSCTKSCDIVLRELKSILNYPKSEKFMHPCTPRDHVAFLRQFRYVSIGTLLVQINKLDYGEVSLWERVLKRHISPSKDRQFCCSPTTKGHPPAHEEVSFTITKFQKIFVDATLDTVISSQEFLVPAIDEGKNQTGNIRRYIPLHILGNNVPIVRKRLVDFCGRHVVKFDNTISRCCSAAEAREITTWQYNRQGGWGGQWRHLTTRDLLVSFTSCMKFLNKYCKDLNVTQTAENEIKIKMESGICQTGNLTRAFEVKFKEVKTNPERIPNLFPNLYCNYQEQTPKTKATVKTPECNTSKATLEKKRQRIKSPRDGADIKWEFTESSSQGKASIRTKPSPENVNKSNNLPAVATAATVSANSSSKSEIIKGGHADGTAQQKSMTKSTNYPEINQSKEPTACSNSGRNSLRHKFKKFPSQNVDEQTLMDLVSSNPFRQSIESMKAIREINMERQKKESDIRTNGKTSQEAKRDGNMQEKSERKTESRPNWSKHTVVLPVITGAQKLKTVSKGTSLQNKVRGVESTNGVQDRKKHLLGKSNVNDTENETSSKERKNHGSILKNSSNATTDLPSSESFCTATTRQAPTSDVSKSSEDGQSDTKSRCFSDSNLEKVKHHGMKTDRDSARGLVTQAGRKIKCKVNQAFLKKTITTKRVSFEGDGRIQLNIPKADCGLPSDRNDSSEKALESNNDSFTDCMFTNEQDDTGLKIVSVQGSDATSMNSVEVCKPLEKARPKSDMNESTVYIDLTPTKNDGDTFHPKKRWVNDFLSFHSDQKSTMVDAQQNKELEQNNMMQAIEQDVQETEEKQNTPSTAAEVKHPNKMIKNDETVTPAKEKTVTELFLLQDSNVDHEEVIDEKLREDVTVINDSDLSIHPQETDFVSKKDFNDKFRVDSPTVDDMANTFNKTIKSIEKKKEKPDESKSSHEFQESHVKSIAEENRKTKITSKVKNGSNMKTVIDVDSYIGTEIVDAESNHLDANKGKNHKKSKGRKKSNTEKKAKKGRKRKPKTAKSVCSVDCEAEELQKAIRIQNVIEEQKRILHILTSKKHVESRTPRENENRRRKSVSENELIDMEAGFSRGAPSSTPTQLLEKVKQSDDIGRKKGIRIKRKNKIEIKQEGEGAPQTSESQISSSISTGHIYPALGIDLFDIGYDVFRDDSGTETGGLVLHPGFILPYVLVNGFQYIALADAYRLFPGCQKSCKILRSTLKNEPALQLTYCTWEQLYVLDLIFFAKGRRLVTGDPMIRFDVLISRYQDLLCALCQRHSTDTKHKCSY
ncbi:uncharacterized protein LOC134240151 [Saccostrea cucullata]|uniref:uncharacterized protein LOC134240151 n=1 Tax=Saccostrea cuccullata TaxID=36930 RepID=UPI002ED2A35C